MTSNFRMGSLILATGALVTAFGAGGRWEWAVIFAALGVLAGVASRWFGARLGTIWLVMSVVAVAIGMLLGLQPAALLVAVSAAVAYWDLDAFDLRLSWVDRTDLTRSLEKSHHLRLLVVLVLGMAVSLLALSVHLNLSLMWAMLLVLVIVISLRMGIAVLMRSTPSRPAE